MPAATFDTLKFANKLKAAGVPPQQAEAEALGEALQVNLRQLVTKEDLKVELSALKAEMKADIIAVRAEMKADISLLKWMVGVNMTLVVPILIRLFLWRGGTP